MRQEALALAPQITRHLLEDDDFDMKDVGEVNEDRWEQIGGDFGDPWTYGGSWFNESQRKIIHFEGTDSDEEAEVDPDTIPVPLTMQRALDSRYPLDYVDPDGDMEWQQRQRDDNERERAKLIGNYQYARAAYLDSNKLHTLYEIDLDGHEWMDRKKAEVARVHGISVEEFEAMPRPNQIIDYGQYMGFHEIGTAFEASRREASRMLRTSL